MHGTDLFFAETLLFPSTITILDRRQFEMGGPKSPIQIKLESRLLRAKAGTSFRMLRLDDEASSPPALPPPTQRTILAEERKVKAKEHLTKVQFVVQRQQLVNQLKQLNIQKRQEERIKSAEKRRYVKMQKICIKAAAMRRVYFHKDKYRRESEKRQSLYTARLKNASKRREEYLTNIVLKASKETQRVESILRADKQAKMLHKRKLNSKLHSAERRRKKYILDMRSKKAKLDNDRVVLISSMLRSTKILQVWWRSAARAASIVRCLRRSNLSKAYAAIFGNACEADFEALSAQLASRATLSDARSIISCLRLAKSSRAANPRILLASTMINTFPEDVLGSANEGGRRHLVQRLQHASKRFAHLLEYLSARITSPIDCSRASCAGIFTQVRTTYIYFVSRFLEWKRDDAKRLAYGMMGAYVDICKQHAQYASLARSQSASDAEDPFTEQICAGYQNQLNTIRSKVKGLIGSKGAAEWLAHAKCALESDERKEAESQQLSSEQIMHDALLDDAYELKRRPRKEPDASSMDTLARELQHKNFDRLIALLEHIRGRMAALTPSRNDLRDELEERIDLELIRSQLSNGVFGCRGARGLVSFIGKSLIALQSPAKEDSTKEWLKCALALLVNETWIIHVPRILDETLRILSELELDVANVQLKVLRSQLKGERGFEYEISKFDAYIKEQGSSIDKVTRMPEGCSAMLRAMLQKHGRQDVRTLIANHILSRIIEGKSGIVETLRLDEAKLQRMRKDVVEVSHRASMSILLRQFFSDSGAPARYVDRLSKTTDALDEDTFVAEMMGDSCFDTKSKAMLRSLLGGKGRVVLEKSIQRHVRALLVKAAKQRQARISETELKSMGLEPWHERVVRITRDFVSLEEHHFCVFGARYTRALRYLLA